MLFSKILFLVIASAAIISAVDYFLGNRLGFGKEFEEGFEAMAPLSLVMVGMACISPYLQEVISRFINPLFMCMGADPSIACSIFIAVDSGCYPLAKQLALDSVTAEFTTFILASTLAPIFGFLMPLGLQSIDKKDLPALAIGCMSGLIAIPFGAVFGGLLLGMEFSALCINLLPIFLFDAFVVLALKYFTVQTIHFFSIFAKFFNGVIVFGLSAAIFQELTGIVFLEKLLPSADTFVVIGNIAFVLAGAYPLLLLIRRLLNQKLHALGEFLKINDYAVVGMMATLANCIPMMATLKKMDGKGIAVNIAFATGAGWVFGDHLGFCAAQSPASLFPMIGGKLAVALIAVAVAGFLYSKLIEK